VTKALVTAHLKNFPAEQRRSLEAMRAQIAAELPDAKEVIKYGIPTFVIDGVPILGFSGYKEHNSLFPYSGSVTSKLEKELAPYGQTKGSIHFEIGKPIPKALLKKIIKAKMQDLKERNS
jgi:uncharacterized protein YdhG (YjbR/CyaY superfamily)